MSIDTHSILYSQMAIKWTMLHDLLGGTRAMRAARTRWLPKEEAEQNNLYELRLDRSFLYNAYGNTVEKLVSKPFSRPVTILGELPDQLVEMEDDIDRLGSNLTQFSRDVFEAGIKYGLSHILVDFPNLPQERTLADERGVMPIFAHVQPPNLIGWQSIIDPQGKHRLVDIRIKEIRIETENFQDKEVTYIRRYTDKIWQLYREEEKEFILIDEGDHTFGAVPLITFYVEKTGFMTADPPLEDLAWLNIAHWQSLSDQRNILRFARSGLLYALGFSDAELDNMVIGPTTFIKSNNEEAKIGYAEHSGAAISAGERDLEKLVEAMEVLGLQPLVERTAKSTATGKMLDESRTQSSIQAWIRSLEDALLGAFFFAAQWMKVDLDIKVNIFNEFGISSKMSVDIDALIKMRAAKEITHETFLREIKRRGILSDAVDVEAEIANVELENPVPGLEDDDE